MKFIYREHPHNIYQDVAPTYIYDTGIEPPESSKYTFKTHDYISGYVTANAPYKQKRIYAYTRKGKLNYTHKWKPTQNTSCDIQAKE